MDDHERKIQPCDLRPHQERLQLSVDLPKQKAVCLTEKEAGERKKGKNTPRRTFRHRYCRIIPRYMTLVNINRFAVIGCKDVCLMKLNGQLLLLV